MIFIYDIYIGYIYIGYSKMRCLNIEHFLENPFPPDGETNKNTPNLAKKGVRVTDGPSGVLSG